MAALTQVNFPSTLLTVDLFSPETGIVQAKPSCWKNPVKGDSIPGQPGLVVCSIVKSQDPDGNDIRGIGTRQNDDQPEVVVNAYNYFANGQKNSLKYKLQFYGFTCSPFLDAAKDNGYQPIPVVTTGMTQAFIGKQDDIFVGTYLTYDLQPKYQFQDVNTEETKFAPFTLRKANVGEPKILLVSKVCGEMVVGKILNDF